MSRLADPCSVMAGNAVSPAPVLEVGEPGSRTRMVRPAASPLVAMVFEDFARAVEAGEPDEPIRLMDPLDPKTPRRRNLDPRLERGGAA